MGCWFRWNCSEDGIKERVVDLSFTASVFRTLNVKIGCKAMGFLANDVDGLATFLAYEDMFTD
jgi:hypothetical protein